MDLQKAKETIITYVKQFETSGPPGAYVDRSRRSLLRRIFPYAISRQAYAELIADRELHEIGDGFGNTPITVVLGPSEPVKRDETYISSKTISSFALRLLYTYQAKGWSESALNLKDEIKKALESYEPTRPY